MKSSPKARERAREQNIGRAERIISAAALVFAKRGVENATMEMIAREAKVAVGTIYLHFASRDEVYLTLRADRAERLGEGYRAVKARGLEPLPEIRALGRVYIEYLLESGDPILISEPIPYHEIRKRLRRASEIRAFERGLKISPIVFRLFEGSVKRAFAQGLMNDSLGPTAVTVAMWSMLNGAFMVTRDGEHLTHTTGLRPEKFLAIAFDSYVHGLTVAVPAKTA
jgi:AcrR family transcriptional regulator